MCICVCVQSCTILCNCNPPSSSVLGIFQARILKWVAISYSRGSSWPRDQTHISCTSCRLGWQVGSIPLASPGRPCHWVRPKIKKKKKKRTNLLHEAFHSCSCLDCLHFSMTPKHLLSTQPLWHFTIYSWGCILLS